MENNKEIEELKKVVRAIILSLKRNGVPIRLLEKIYKESEGKNIPLFNYHDTIDVLNSLDDTVYTGVRHGQILVFPVHTDKSRHIQDLVAGQHSTKRCARGNIGRAPLKTDFRHKDPDRSSSRKETPKIMVNTNSMRINNNVPYNNNYYKYANSIDTPQTNGVESKRHTDSVNGRVQSISKTNHNEQMNNGYDRTSVNTVDTQQVNDDNDPDKDDSSFELKVDFEMLQFEEQHIEFDGLPTIKFDKCFTTGTSFRVYLTQIHSPYRFWFHLKEDVEQIDTLMSGMDYFYNSDESMIAKRPIPEQQLMMGRVCAALFDSQWHRAEIVEVLDESLVVFYVDYGTIDEVEKKNVRFLNKRFSKSPIYAHRGCLDRCKPNDGIWTFEAMNVFERRMNDFKDTAVLVKLTNVNVPEKTLYFDMFDTRGKIDVSISEFMIDNNLAYPTNKLLFDFQKRHYNEVYPSFDKLESGKYPSRERMKQMLDNGFDYLEYEDSILIPEMYGYETIE